MIWKLKINDQIKKEWITHTLHCPESINFTVYTINIWEIKKCSHVLQLFFPKKFWYVAFSDQYKIKKMLKLSSTTELIKSLGDHSSLTLQEKYVRISRVRREITRISCLKKWHKSMNRKITISFAVWNSGLADYDMMLISSNFSKYWLLSKFL